MRMTERDLGWTGLKQQREGKGAGNGKWGITECNEGGGIGGWKLEMTVRLGVEEEEKGKGKGRDEW